MPLLRFKHTHRSQYRVNEYSPSPVPQSVGGSVSGTKKDSKALESFCRDLCAEARANRLDPVIGRSIEVARVMQILARRRKNNPILLGEPGVGKTAIAEGLATAIVVGKGDDGFPLPTFLIGASALQLNPHSLHLATPLHLIMMLAAEQLSLHDISFLFNPLLGSRWGASITGEEFSPPSLVRTSISIPYRWTRVLTCGVDDT